jgi:hypothetical protein
MKLIKTSNGKEIKIYDDLIPYDVRLKLYKFINNSLFRVKGNDEALVENQIEQNIFSSYSKSDLDNTNFLKIPEIQHILKEVKGYEIYQTRINLGTLSDKNHFHVDSGLGTDFKSLLYYPNMRWIIDWGGYTLFANENLSEIEYCASYKPGRIILFDGTIPHCAAPPSNFSPCFRYSFIIQFYKN